MNDLFSLLNDIMLTKEYSFRFILSTPGLCSQLIKIFAAKMPSVWMVLGFMEDPKNPGELMSVAYVFLTPQFYDCSNTVFAGIIMV